MEDYHNVVEALRKDTIINYRNLIDFLSSKDKLNIKFVTERNPIVKTVKMHYYSDFLLTWLYTN